MHDRSPRRRLAHAVSVVALGCILVVVAWYAAWLVFLYACDAEVGLVDSSSAAGRFCGSPAGVGWLLLALIGAPIAAVALGWAALRRRSLRRPMIFLATVTGLLVIVGGVMLALPGQCSDAQRRAYDRWQDEGSNGEPPAECDSY